MSKEDSHGSKALFADPLIDLSGFKLLSQGAEGVSSKRSKL